MAASLVGVQGYGPKVRERRKPELGQLEAELERILEERRLTPLFQPIVDHSKREIFGFEALIRGPSDSPLHSPLQLFDVATRCNRLFELDLLCRQIALEAFVEQNLPGKISINVSPSTLVDSDFRSGKTLKSLQENGIDPDSVIIEITEHHPVSDYGLLSEAIRHYRNMGFSVAMDDLGGGYSNLRLWSEVHPDFVKIDKHFIQGIHEDSHKRQFVSSIQELASKMQCTVICEGVETPEEFATLRDLGVPLTQGYYYARPHPRPALSLAARLFKIERETSSCRTSIRSAAIATPNPTRTSRTRVEEIAEFFLHHAEADLLPIVDKGKVRGMVWRHDFMNVYASRFGRDLHGRKPIHKFMDRNPIVVDADLHVETLSRIITDRNNSAHHHAFIVTESGSYLGVGQTLDLLRTITDMQVRNARHANPLTLLPGNVPLSDTAQELLDEKKGFTACYVDIDNFKAFNDSYGYKKGDNVILIVADLLRDHVGDDLDFVGHIGGDDFMVLFQARDWQSRCQAILADFERRVQGFYHQDDLARGGIEVADRTGTHRFFPVMSLSIGAVPAPPGRFADQQALSDVASEVKKQAKARPGNALFIDRRAAESEPTPA